MANAEQYAAWIVANKDKKGTPEFETVASAYKLARGEKAEAPVVKSPPLGEMSGVERFTNEMVKPVGAGGKGFNEFLRATPIGAVARMLNDAHSVRPVVQGGADAPVGAAQLLMNVAGQGDKINPWVKAQEQAYQATRKDPEAFDPGRMGGNILGPLALLSGGTVGGTSAVARAFNSIAALAKSTVGRIPQGAAVGGISAAAQPMENFDSGEKVLNTLGGVAFGGAVPSLWELSKMVGRGGRNLWQSQTESGIDKVFGRMANRTAGDKRDEILRLLENAKANVPGSPITAGQAAVPANRAEFAAFQDLTKNANPSLYIGEGVEGVQENARLALLRSFAKDKDSLDKAVAARSANANTKYGQVGNDLISKDPVLADLMSRPSMKHVMPRAADLAAERKQTFVIGKDSPEKTVSSLLVGENGAPLSQTVIPQEFAKYPVQSLQNVKMAMDDLIKNPERFGIGSSEAAAVGGTRKEFINWLSEKSPGWAEARQGFARDSVNPNQMEVGQFLINKLTSPLETGERAGVFGQAMRDAPRTIKGATGSPVFTELEQVLLPQNMQKSNQVLADLQNNARFKELSQGGMEQARRDVGAALPRVPSTGILMPALTAARAGINAVLGKDQEKALARGAVAMLDPKLTAMLMKNAKPYERQALLDLLMKQYATGVGQLPNQQ